MKTTKYVFILVFGLFAKASAQSAGEQAWVWQYPKPQGNTLRDICILGRDTAVAVGEVGTVVKTTDGGTYWDVQHHAGGTLFDLRSVHFPDPMHGWAVGKVVNPSRNVVIKTEDGGSHWSEVPTDTSLYYSTVFFVDADTGFVAGEDGILLRTTDGGRSWDIRKIDDYIGLGWLDVFDLDAFTFTDKQTGWLVGFGYYGNQIYKTTDGGDTWIEQQSPPSSQLMNVFFINASTGWAIGDGIIKTSNGGGVDGIRDPGVTLQQLPGQITLLQNYPNPFNGTTVIRYHLPRSGLVSLKVYDILGRLVSDLVERWESKGDHAVVLEANSLSSGVYFYRLKSDSYSTTKAMTLIR